METKPSLLFNVSLPIGSYPTYEEWKQENLVIIDKSNMTVLILPMRNGKPRDVRVARLDD